jgi:hypothetical protein
LVAEAIGRFRELSGPRSLRRLPALEALAVGLLAVFLYVGLASELPIDDARRYRAGVEAGVFEWDAAHLLMQPVAVLWHRWVGFGAPALVSQQRFNAVCAGLALGIFHLLLARLGLAAGRRLALTALAAASFNVLCLATSGHIKLAVFPFLALALYHASLWERERWTGRTRGDGRLAVAAAALGLAAAFLLNSAVVAPFLGLAAFAVILRTGGGPRRAAAGMLGVGAVSGATALVLVGGAYPLVTPPPHDLGGFVGFLLAKAAVAGQAESALESVARGGFGVIQNFVYLGDFGAMAREWLAGRLPESGWSGGALLAQTAAFLAAAGLLGAGLLGAARRLARAPAGGSTGGARTVPWAFLLGALAFAIPWNLNEADFYFQITLPVVLLLASAPASHPRWLELALLALVAVTVLGGWSLPRRGYPLQRYQAELRAELGGRDLAVYWFDYAGGPSLIFFDLPGLERLHPDRLHREIGPQRFFPELARRLDERLAAGGRVLLFGVLDGRSWNAPWPWLRGGGLSPARFEAFLHRRYEVRDLGPVAEIPCWELRPRGAGPAPTEDLR